MAVNEETTRIALTRYEVDFEGDPRSLVYTFGGAAPVASLHPPCVLETSTLDCYAGRVTSVEHLPSQRCDPRLLNPQTGPFYIEGAEPGDTLVVHFARIEPHFSWGVSSTVPFFGSLTATPMTAMLHTPLPELTWIYEIDLKARVVCYEARERTGVSVALPLDPMHGTVGVAPALGEARSSLTPGPWGGNMDTPEMRAGTTCYLGVNVEGALWSLGDGHARQGEGETCGVAVETAMDSVVALDVLKTTAAPWPRLEDDKYLMTTGSARPLEDAFRVAHQQMVHWVSELCDLTTMDAYQLVSQIALTPIANVVDTNYTVVAKVAKAHLPAAKPAMGGAHTRLRRRAQDYLRS